MKLEFVLITINWSYLASHLFLTNALHSDFDFENSRQFNFLFIRDELILLKTETIVCYRYFVTS